MTSKLLMLLKFEKIIKFAIIWRVKMDFLRVLPYSYGIIKMDVSR